MQIAIVIHEGFTALDAIGPYEVLRGMPNAEVRFVSDEVGPIVTDSGFLVVGATHTYAETPRPDIVLVPGSTAETPTAMRNKALISWLQEVHQHTKFTLSVCTGSLVLAAAGILEGHPATSHWMAQIALGQFGAEARKNDRIVESGKIVTAAGVSAGIDLGLHIVKKLHGKEMAEKIQLVIEYDPMPPVDAGHPSKASKSVLNAARKDMLTQQSVRGTVSIPIVLWRQTLNKLRKKFKSPVTA